jgi:TonB family protein
LRIPSARPPAPVEQTAPQIQAVTKIVPTTVRFAPEFDLLGSAQTPEWKFTASGHESPQAAHFRVAVNANGEVRHCFLQSSSGDAALDEQARKFLALTRFSILHPLPAVALAKEGPSPILAALTWGTATVEWGNDIVPSSPNPGPRAP